jgi:hypothetical protein
LLIGNQKIYVLVRQDNYSRKLKKADGGDKSATLLTEESEFLSLPENYMLVQALHEGRTISL